MSKLTKLINILVALKRTVVADRLRQNRKQFSQKFQIAYQEMGEILPTSNSPPYEIFYLKQKSISKAPPGYPARTGQARRGFLKRLGGTPNRPFNAPLSEIQWDWEKYDFADWFYHLSPISRVPSP
jgi:hypothetical protein